MNRLQVIIVAIALVTLTALATQLLDRNEKFRFYGLVVDEFGAPVEGAEVLLTVFRQSLLLNTQQTPVFSVRSDSAGRFFKATSGNVLIARASKEGYYTVPDQSDVAFYRKAFGDGVIPTDAAHPGVVLLRRKGAVATNLKSLSWVKFSMQPNGPAVGISLETGKEVAPENGDLVAELIEDDSKWQCRISVPGGGLQRRWFHMDFKAPLDGYRETDLVTEVRRVNEIGSGHAQRHYFIKTGSRKFARVDLRMDRSGGFTLENYSLNPDGSNNLESGGLNSSIF